MKRFNVVPVVILGALLIACLVALYATRESTNRPAAIAKSAEDDAAVAADLRLLDTADRVAALAETNDERTYAQQAQRLADHELDQAFATALRQAVAYRPPAGPLRDLANRVNQLKMSIADEKDRVAQLAKQTTAHAADEADLLNAQMALDVDELEDVQQDLARQGGDPHASLERALQQHEAAQHQAAQNFRYANASPTATLVEQVRTWSSLGTVNAQITAAEQAAADRAAALTNRHNDIDKRMAPGQDGAAPPDSNTADRIANLHRLSGQTKTLSELDQRIQDCRQLAGAYLGWSGLLETRRRVALHALLGSSAEILGILLVAMLANIAIRRLFRESERKRLHQMRVMAAVAVQLVALVLMVLVIFGAPTQISTIIGLTTAGLTVVLRDFIVGFFGWFALMGKNGIRVGDWVEINGVSGEVIQIGLLKTVILESGNWTDTGHPTGRQVAFSNSFAMDGHFFNFSTAGQWLWDELEVTLPATGDPYLTAEEIRKLVERETAADSAQAAQDWERVTRQVGAATFSAKPAVNLRPTVNGLEVVVRYITRAPQRYTMRSRLFQVIVDLLHKPAIQEAAGADATSAVTVSAPPNQS